MALPFRSIETILMMSVIIGLKYDGRHQNVNAERRQREMKVTQEQKAQNRTRILTEAGRLFREKGFEAVSVAEVMKAAGMTHGGFYGHFQSKDDLVAQTIAHAIGSQSVIDDLGTWIDTYLSQLHREHPDLGCPMAALAGFMRQQAPEARASMAQVLGSQINTLTDVMPGVDAAQRRRAAIGSWSAMVGALILSRSIDDPELSAEVLSETRAWIGEKTMPD
ncbi:TetR/AcrR family transcriptional regulator [Sphingobium soli]|uniref:TetR/AcrR family transcriptional regulator n=1 Tax=Sphingobium soli TaxID=1591116 RepID=A0ABS8H4B3_9SPHN|nr:TetR/AcrR family transcriptional regulator [Sphingobium soli]MCC4233364.1 TetR/AcrR family transcriptional regulator [Sphingobium soli]